MVAWRLAQRQRDQRRFDPGALECLDPTGGAQDFLGANLPGEYWVEPKGGAARL